jgi:hypothetical protein
MNDATYLVIGRCGGVRPNGRCRRVLLRAWLDGHQLMVERLVEVTDEASTRWAPAMSSTQARHPQETVIIESNPRVIGRSPNPGYKAACDHCRGPRHFNPDDVENAARRAIFTGRTPHSITGWGPLDSDNRGGIPIYEIAQKALQKIRDRR